MSNPHQPATDSAFRNAVRDTAPLTAPTNGEAAAQANHIVSSGIANEAAQREAMRPMLHLYVFKAWFKPPGSRLPTKETAVEGRVCAGTWDEALVKTRAWLRVSCLANKLAADAYEIYELKAHELDMPVDASHPVNQHTGSTPAQ